MKVKTVQEILEVLQPIADSMNIEIVEVEFKQGREPSLTVYIDIETGVDLNTCEAFHRAIDPVIDEHDPIENAYHLEVSSPGIERVLRTEEHIEAWAGEEVEAKLFAPMDGKKSIRGILGGIENGVVTIECGEKSYAIEHKKISRMTTVFDF